MHTVIKQLITLAIFINLAAHAVAQCNIDSLKVLVLSKSQDTAAISTRLLLAGCVRYEQPDSALLWCRSALAISIERKNEKALQDCYECLSLTYLQKPYFEDSAVHFARKQVEVSERSGDIDMRFESYRMLVEAFKAVPNNDSALVFAYKAADLTKLFVDTARIIDAKWSVASVFRSMLMPDQALPEYQDIVALAAIQGDSILMARAMNGIGICYDLKKEYASSLASSTKAAGIFLRHAKTDLYHRTLNNIAVVYWHQGELSKALSTFEQVLTYFEKTGNHSAIATITQNMANVNYERKDFAEAIKHFTRSVEMAQLASDRNNEYLSSGGLARSYEGLGNYKEAVNWYKRHQELGDSIAHNTQREMAAELEARFKNKEKAAELLLLSAKAETNRQQRNFFIAIAIVLTVIFLATMLIVMQRRRFARIHAEEQKARALMEARNKIAQDLHDDVGSTLSSITMFSRAIRNRLERRQYDDLIPAVDDIGQSSQEMLDHMSDMVWAINPRNDTFERLVSRLKLFAGQLAEAGNIQLHFETDEQVFKEHISMEVRKNVFLILKEAINNAMKYSGTSELWVSIVLQKGQLVAYVQDKGKGFDSVGLYDGNGLQNMRNRAKEIAAELYITSVLNLGCTIRLEVSPN